MPKDEGEAAAEFERKHGRPPAFIWATKHGGGVLRAGPVGDDVATRHRR